MRSTIYNAKTLKQPKYPSANDWIKKMWHIYIYTHTHTHINTDNMEYYSAIKEQNTAICNNVEGPREYLVK